MSRATYKGVRWRRDDGGTVTWWNDGINRWVRWYPGADAPPRPPRWEAAGGPALPPRLDRARWRSPYRLVPVVLVVLVVAVGIYQATKTTDNPVGAETRAALALVGKCLAQNGTLDGQPQYKPSPVPCELPVADVKVISVHSGLPGGPPCPDGTTAVQLRTVGVRYPHVECVEAVKG